MKDMSLTADEAKEYNHLCYPGDGDGPKYPYGLCLDLGNATLQKLGITDLPQVGTKINISAVAQVVSVEQRQEQDGKNTTRMSLQIVEMETQKPAQTDADLASKMWPGKAE